MTKHIFVTGGVVSFAGQGSLVGQYQVFVTRSRGGLSVRMQKLDPYNQCRTRHYESVSTWRGLCVLDDGAECDLDLGHYERFTHGVLNRDSNYTHRKNYQSVITKERRGEYLGKNLSS